MVQAFKKVTIPQFVADWIEHAKFEDYHLLGAMDEAHEVIKKLEEGA